MMIPRIDNVLTAEDLLATSTHTTGLEEVLGFCVGLEPRDRSTLFKLGAETETFVAQIIALAQIHIDLVPRGTNIPSLVSRQATRLVLRNQHNRLQPLIQRVDNTVMLIGADVLRDCLALYKVLKAYGKTAGLEELLAGVAQRFKRSGSGLLIPGGDPETPVPTV